MVEFGFAPIFDGGDDDAVAFDECVAHMQSNAEWRRGRLHVRHVKKAEVGLAQCVAAVMFIFAHVTDILHKPWAAFEDDWIGFDDESINGSEFFHNETNYKDAALKSHFFTETAFEKPFVTFLYTYYP